MTKKNVRSRLLQSAASAVIFPFLWAGISDAQTPRTTTYTYDALGRLTFVTDTVNGNRDYDYDAAGNRRNVAVGTANDAASEPGALPTPPQPTGLTMSNPTNCTWQASWNASSGATSYRFKDTNNAVATQAGTSRTISCPLNSPQYNKPNWVQACNANGCSARSYFQ